MIGLAASTLLLGAGEIMGASGIISSFILNPKKALFDDSTAQDSWKRAYIASFCLCTLLVVQNDQHPVAIRILQGDQGIVDPELVNLVKPSTIGYVISGFLVGMGTRLGNGCTSGHGICGLARFSRRSLAAVVSFMLTGILSASLCGPDCVFAKFLRTKSLEGNGPTNTSKTVANTIALISIASFGKSVMMSSKHFGKAYRLEKQFFASFIRENAKKISASLSGALFSFGLAISTMIKPSKIVGFLDVTGLVKGTYDPTLLAVMGGGLGVSMMSYQAIKDYQVPFVAKHMPGLVKPPMLCQRSSETKFSIPKNTIIDKQLIAGSMLFGLGWGIGGLCPGPALYAGIAGIPNVLYYWWPGFIGGTFLGTSLKK